jgi:hypothetical protein
MKREEGAPAGQAESPNSPSQDHHYVSTTPALTHGRRRWTRHASLSAVACDVIVWVTWLAIVVATIAAMLAVFELARP